MHPAFRELGEEPFGHGYCIADPRAPERVARDAERLSERVLIQLCTFADAWAPEAKKHESGPRCLEAILPQPVWSVRILIKNAAARGAFDLIEQHRDRVLLGLGLTATPEDSDVGEVLEPNASGRKERMLALEEASGRGIRTYGILCPLLPAVADSPEHIEQLVKFVAG